MVSNRRLAFALAVLGSARGTPAEAQESGETLFRTVCTACHSTGSNRVVGPGLGGVLERREYGWLVSKVTEPDRLAAQGDAITTALIAEYGMTMPKLGVTADQAKAVLAYLAEVAATPATRPAEAAVAEQVPGEGLVLLGESLFQGTSRFQNRGASCNSCHDVTHAGVIGGGSLAVGLTDAYARLGRPALTGLLASPPFPMMRRAYMDRALTQDEVLALVAFLQQVDAGQALPSPINHGARLLAAGLAGTLLLLGISSLAWRGRRRGPVNQAVFDRQVKTS